MNDTLEHALSVLVASLAEGTSRPSGIGDPQLLVCNWSTFCLHLKNIQRYQFARPHPPFPLFHGGHRGTRWSLSVSSVVDVVDTSITVEGGWREWMRLADATSGDRAPSRGGNSSVTLGVLSS